MSRVKYENITEKRTRKRSSVTNNESNNKLRSIYYHEKIDVAESSKYTGNHMESSVN